MMRTKLLPFLVLILSYQTGFSQKSDLGNWMIYFGNKKINSRFNLHNEVQYRNYNAIGDLEQLLLRTGLGINLSENNNNLLIGYGFINSQNQIDLGSAEATKIGINEHRIFQQFITRQSFSRLKLQHRYRFEQRWIENTNFKLRFRYFLSLNVAINNEDMEDNTLYGSFYNEIFINNTQVVFDRNRLYAGLGYKVNNRVKFEIGYMNQFLNNNNRDQVNLITFLNF